MATKLNVKSHLFNQKDILDVEPNIATDADVAELESQLEDKADTDGTPQIYYTNQEPDKLILEEGLLDKLKLGDIVIANHIMFLVNERLIEGDTGSVTIRQIATDNNYYLYYYINDGDGWALDDSETVTQQEKLFSGINIKTINNNSILGAGNLSISGGTQLYELGLKFSSSYDEIIAIDGIGNNFFDLDAPNADALNFVNSDIIKIIHKGKLVSYITSSGGGNYISVGNTLTITYIDGTTATLTVTEIATMGGYIPL